MSITNLSQNNKFRNWLDKINEIIDALNEAVNDIISKAPKLHTSPYDTYGLGSELEYGHVKLSDDITSNLTASDGVAVTPSAVQNAYDNALDAVVSLGENITETVDTITENIATLQSGKAPNMHSSKNTTYGVGSNDNYGHVKLTTDLNLDADSTQGIAVAPSAVKIINDKLTSLSSNVEKKANTNHSSTDNTYGLGSELEYGHVKLSDDITSNLTASNGVAATIGSVKKTYELASKADKNASDALIDIQEKAPINHASVETVYGVGTSSVYGHVKVTDSISLDSPADNGIVPSAKALKETYLKASSAYDLATELKNSGGIGGGDTNGTSGTITRLLGDNEDLNFVVNNGVYISNKASQSLNYPYTEEDCISLLEVSRVNETTDYIIIKQILYSRNALYVRDSLDGGASWGEWVLISKSVENNTVEIYVSLEFGDDANSGLTSDSPILSSERLFELINIQSILASNEIGNIDIKVFFDEGTYDTFTKLVNIPMSIQITSLHTKKEDNKDDENVEDETITVEEVEEPETIIDISKIPYFPNLRIENSRVSLSGLKIDNLYAQENSIVVIESDNYMSLGHIESTTGSIIYISSLYASDDESNIVPLNIHNIIPSKEDSTEGNLPEEELPEEELSEELPEEDTLESIFCATDYGRIYDTRDREISFVSDIKKSYIFECSYYGEITLPSITFIEVPENFNIPQYSLTSNSSLYHPKEMIGDPTNNVIEVNTRLQGVLWGGGSTAQYLRADGKWMSVPNPKGDSTKTKYLRDDGTWVTLPDARYSDMTGATATVDGVSGLVPAPKIENLYHVLGGDGEWHLGIDAFKYTNYSSNNSTQTLNPLPSQEKTEVYTFTKNFIGAITIQFSSRNTKNMYYENEPTKVWFGDLNEIELNTGTTESYSLEYDFVYIPKETKIYVLNGVDIIISTGTGFKVD